MMLVLSHLLRSRRLFQFVKFCTVGGSGVVVDMTLFCLLADPRFLALNVTFSKILAAEAAMISNFTLNELWTFRQSGSENNRLGALLRRFLLFNAICGIGIGLAVLLLNLFYSGLKWNLYLSNLLAIIMVTFWNFGMNTRFNWRITAGRDGRSTVSQYEALEKN